MKCASYNTIVRDTLNDKWQSSIPDLQINSKNVNAGTVLFTEIAIEATAAQNERGLLNRSHSTSKITPDSEVLPELVDKIKGFVNSNALYFKEICNTGFPFAFLERGSTYRALKNTLENYYGDSIISQLMRMTEDWMDEEELNQHFNEAFQCLSISEIAKACYELCACAKIGDIKATYYLLWLFKLKAEISYEISYNMNVEDFFKKIIEKPELIKNKRNFIEIFLYHDYIRNHARYLNLLGRGLHAKCIDFALSELNKIPLHEWPSKFNLIVYILMLKDINKLKVSSRIASSSDSATAEIGNHLLRAFIAHSLTEAIPHFDALIDRYPDFRDQISNLFKHPFPELCIKSPSLNDVAFAKRLNFKGINKVYTQGPLMVCLYNHNRTFSSSSMLTSYLLAYNMESEKMVWGISLNTLASEKSPLKYFKEPEEYIIEKVGDCLALQFRGKKQVILIYLETGEINSSIELPETYDNHNDMFHFSPQGYGYQTKQKNSNCLLIGGKIVNKKWKTNFQIDASAGYFCALSTHCGFHKEIEDFLIVVGPTSDQTTIERCIACQAKDDKLYCIERDPGNAKKCYLTIRSLKMNCEVVSDIEKRIPIDVDDACEITVCQNAWIILFKESENSFPVFVNINTQEVVYGKYIVSNFYKRIVNIETGEVWMQDPVENKIWKISPFDIKEIGSVEDNFSRLLFVDKENCLYYR